jgi:hypothetical protein
MPCPTTHKILAPQGFRKEIITEAHNSKFAGHGGRFKTLERLRQDIWWPNMDKGIKEHIDQCKPCQTTTDKGKPPDVPITGLQITSGTSQRIHADLFIPLQNSERGNMYILVIIDAFTKMARLTAIDRKDAATVTRAMMNNMYSFGVPHTVLTDQGPEFVSQMQNILFDSLNIDRKVTTGYHPTCNGAAEQFNKIMINNIKAQMQQQGKSTLDWEQCLAPIMLYYNTSINKSTKITPFHATFNYNPRVPLWSGVEHRFDKHLKNATGKDTSIHENLARLRSLHYNTRKIVHHNLQHTADLREEENWKALPEAKWPAYKINQIAWNYIDAKKRDKLEVRTIMGKSDHRRHPEHSNIQDQEGSWAQEGQDRQHAETETKTLWRRGRTTRPSPR